MNFSWFWLAALSGITETGYNTISRVALKNGGSPSYYTWWFSLVRSVIFFIPALFFSTLDLSLNNLVILSVLGFFNCINVYLFMKMHSLNQLSVSTIISRLRIVWVPILAFFIVGEKLMPKQYIAIIVLLIAVILLRSPKKLLKDKAMFTAVLFSVTTAVVTVFLKMASDITSTSMVIFAMSFPSVIIIPLIITSAKQKLLIPLRKYTFEKLAISGLSIVLIYTFIWALKLGGKVGAVNAIFQSISALSVVVGIILLKEKELIFPKLAGAILVIVGAMLLI